MNLHVGIQRAQIRALSSDVEKTRTVEFILSSEKRDRYGTVLFHDKWELNNFNKNGLVGYNHPFMSEDPKIHFDPDKVIGVGRSWVDYSSRLLMGSVRFLRSDVNPKAEKVFQHVLSGSIQSCSVGFFETKAGHYGSGDEAYGGKKQTYYYGGQELYEFSIVDLPGNTDATIKSNLRQLAKHTGCSYFPPTQSVAPLDDIERILLECRAEILECKMRKCENSPKEWSHLAGEQLKIYNQLYK